MMRCIKTGAVVHFEEWHTNVPCDLYSDGTIGIVRFNPNLFYGAITREVTHKVWVGNEGYIDKAAGIAVVGMGNLKEA